MKVQYKCSCHPLDVTLDVPDRRPHTDILVWMEIVTACISYDHAQMSPRCRETSMTYVKIPLQGEQIGTPPTVN